MDLSFTPTPMKKAALGTNSRMAAQEKEGDFETRFDNGTGAYVIVESSPNTIGGGFSEQP